MVTFPINASDGRLNRQIVKNILEKEWGQLFNHVISFGNIDFSRRWVFFFDMLENNDMAVAKEIFINGSRIKTVHAKQKFNVLKIDWVPVWMKLDKLADKIKMIPGVSGRFVDIRRARGDRIDSDSTQVIARFYQDPTCIFNPPQYIFYHDKYGAKNFLHLIAIGQVRKCMRCNQDGHNIANCPKKFCHKCGKLVDREEHICFSKPSKSSFNYRVQEATPKSIVSIDSDWSDLEQDQKQNNTSASNITTNLNVTSNSKLSNSYASKLNTPKRSFHETMEKINEKKMEILARGRGSK